MTRKKIIYLFPLVVFALLVCAFALLLLRPEKIEMISRPLPHLEGLSAEDLRGEVSLINFFASWCVPCRAEHEWLVQLSQEHGLSIYGVAYKDKKQDTEKYLEELGNPYRKIIRDEKGRSFIDWGLSGVPETFLIGKNGMVRYHHPGVLLEEDMEETILPLVKELDGL